MPGLEPGSAMYTANNFNPVLFLQTKDFFKWFWAGDEIQGLTPGRHRDC